MLLNNEQKMAIKSSAKQLLNIKKAKASDLDLYSLNEYISQAMQFLGLDGDNDDISELVRYEYLEPYN